MRQAYPSDITREQFEKIREELEGAKKNTHPRKYDLYDIFCAVLYLLKEGCTWRALPHDYPHWQNFIPFPSFLNAGLLSVPLAGLINAADFGKIVRDFCKILFRCFLSLLSALFSEDTKQALKFIFVD